MNETQLLSGVPKLLNIVTGGGLNWHLIDIRASTRKRPNRPFSYPKVAELQMTGAYVDSSDLDLCEFSMALTAWKIKLDLELGHTV